MIGTDRVRVGVIGGGWIAESIVDALVAFGADLVGMVDTDPNRRSRWSQMMPTFATVDELLDLGPLVVVILTPTPTHPDLACAALARGCDVIVEKPLASDPAGAARILTAQRTHRRTVLVEESYLWTPSHLAAMRAVADGRIGEVRAILHTFHGWLPLPHRAAAVAFANDQGWRAAAPFEWVRDHAVHLLALSKRLSGAARVTDVRALGGPSEGDLRGAVWRCGVVDVVWLRATKGTEGVLGRATGLHTRIIGSTGWMDVIGEGGSWGGGGPVDAIRFSDGSSTAVQSLDDRLWIADTGYYPDAHRRSVAAALHYLVSGEGRVYTAEDAADDVQGVTCLIEACQARAGRT